ncbi:butyrophilin 2 [Labeo rohita]|uniref:Butyrophilin 2 n=1 Tax=Labeo rohita TaxID=84645 RepID=A0A498NYJ4_LABRO|nr:butyrophilin 2 [Labeo rohita]
MVLPCYVDELLLMEGLKVEWRKTDSGTLVHLYQNGESRPEAQKQDYHDRAHFFTDQIQHGNFSLHLGNLTAEDEGRYTCKIYSQQDSGETVVQIKYVEHLLVSGSDESVSASVGEDVTLNCSVNSPITPEHTEEVSWKKTDKDEHILVLLYQNNKTLSDSSDERYRGRVEFFTAEIPKGNFSLRLKSVRTEDKGVYMCQVFAGGLSANATIVLETLGDYRSLLLQVSGLTVRSSSGPAVLRLGSSGVLPCYVNRRLLEKTRNVEWRRTDSQTLVHLCLDDESQSQQDYHDRAHFFTDQIQCGNFSLRLDKLRAEDEGEYTCKVYRREDSVSRQEDSVSRQEDKPVLSQDKSGTESTCFFASVWEKLLNFAEFDRAVIIFLFLIMFLCCLCKIIYHAIGWGCVILFLQLLWTVMKFTGCYGFIAQDFPRVVPVYVFGSVGVVLLNSVALMTELILKTGEIYALA